MEHNITSFQTYLKALCVAHKEVLHNDAANVAYVRFQSDDDLNQVVNQGASTIVILTRFYGKSTGATADDMNMKQFVGIRFACAAIPHPTMNYSDVITAALDKAFTVMMDFLTRMREEVMEDNCGPLRGLELESASWNEIPEQPYLTQHYGWDLALPFKSEYPEHDPNRWNDL
jgi:hypothetical protein